MLIHPKHKEGATRQAKDSAGDNKLGMQAPQQQQQQHAAVGDPEARAKLRRVVAGVLPGVTERFLSHPVETCKVVLQNTPASASAAQVLSSRWRDKGLASFYRGTTTTTCCYRYHSRPLLSVSASLSSLTPPSFIFFIFFSTARHCAEHPGPRPSNLASLPRYRCVHRHILSSSLPPLTTTAAGLTCLS
jgi:hypothetical protein